MDPVHFIPLNGEDIVCKKHLEGIENRQELFQFFDMIIGETMNHPLFKDFCGRDEEKGVPARIDRVPDVIKNIGNLCCFLRDSKIQEIKDRIKAIPKTPEKEFTGIRTFTPINFIQKMGWKRLTVLKEKIQAESYAKGYSDSRSKTEVVILKTQTSDDAVDWQYEIWIRELNNGNSSSK